MSVGEGLITLVRILWGPVTSGTMLLSNRPRPAGVANSPFELRRRGSNPRGDREAVSEPGAPAARLQGLLCELGKG